MRSLLSWYAKQVKSQFFFSEKIHSYNPIRYHLVILTSSWQPIETIVEFVISVFSMGCHFIHKKNNTELTSWHCLIDVSSADDSKLARIARKPCKRARRGKPNRGLSQCEHTGGRVSPCGRSGGGWLNIRWTLFGVWRKWSGILVSSCKHTHNVVTYVAFDERLH